VYLPLARRLRALDPHGGFPPCSVYPCGYVFVRVVGFLWERLFVGSVGTVDEDGIGIVGMHACVVVVVVVVDLAGSAFCFVARPWRHVGDVGELVARCPARHGGC
jgi:hypothetical protein